MEFIKGLWVEKPKEGTPEFVKAKISINAEFIEWYNANKNDKGYVNIDILASKDDESKWWAKHNDWKPEGETANTSNIPEADESIPF